MYPPSIHLPEEIFGSLIHWVEDFFSDASSTAKCLLRGTLGQGLGYSYPLSLDERAIAYVKSMRPQELEKPA